MNAQQTQIHDLATLIESAGPMRVGGRIVSDQEKGWITEGLRLLAAHLFVDALKLQQHKSARSR